jgi:hypothetical protein
MKLGLVALAVGLLGGPRRKTSLFCWVVVRPNTNEVELVKTAKELKTGAFACDQHAIYSNVTNVGGLPTIAAIRGSMDVKLGGPWETALNTPLFQMVYRKMFYDGHFRNSDWVVKLDADTVVNVPDLREVMAQRAGQAKVPSIFGHFNDGGVIHGAIMVMSVPALNQYAKNLRVCELHVDSSSLSEDWYIGYCFQYLGMKIQKIPRVLKQVVPGGHYGSTARRRSDATGGGGMCNKKFIAFHPLKNTIDYNECVRQLSAV